MINTGNIDKFQLFFFSGIILSILLMLAYQFFPENYSEKESGIETRMFITQSDDRKSVFEFRTVDPGYKNFDRERFISGYKYAYLWIDLFNNGGTDNNIVLLNRTRNYYTELLLPDRLGAVTLFRHGDKVPVSASPFKSSKPAFPLIVPAGGQLSVIIEYHGPAGLVIAPEITTAADFIERSALDNGFKGLICGIFIILLIISLINIIILSWCRYFPVLLLMVSVFFFYLRQSRILLFLIDPLVYPDWLYPVSIALNVVAVVILVYRFLNSYLDFIGRLVLKITGIFSVIFGVVSIAVYPFIAADLLNLLSFFLIPVTAAGLYRAVRKQEQDILNIIVSFLPWIAAALIDIISSLMLIALRSPEVLQASGMVASIFLLSVSLQNIHFKHYNGRIDSLAGELELAQNELTRQVSSIAEFKRNTIHKIGCQLRQPLDSILALTSILANEYAFPEISSVCRLLTSETKGLKHMVNNEIELLYNPESDIDTELLEIPKLRPWIDSCICIYDSDPVHSSRTAMILRSSGYEVRIVSDQYQALSLINSGRIDVLVIEPSSTGETSFSLCGLVRSDFNMFEVPILMITDYHADFLMRKGYSAGVNDFLTTPFDSSELSARIQSLIKLKKIAKHNHDLAKSEKEKNTFLYFLTHNINTPLTILINRINELSGFEHDDALSEITDDLQAASREINDIVRNILISFRLSDGRHTVRLKTIDMEEVITAIAADLQSKASEKKQRIIVDIDGGIPAVVGDPSALRGILYNLADNGLKFSPEHGTVRIMVSGGDSVVVKVEDNGPGIPEYEQNRLFERFQRLSPQPTAGESSTGLGLYVAYELAKMNGGDLFYENGYKGACFVFTLPAAKESFSNV